MANNDYHIYLHNTEGGYNPNSASVQTKPFENRKDDSGGGRSDSLAPFIQKGMQTTYSTVTSGGGAYVSQGIAMLGKVNPYVMLAIAVTMTVSKILVNAMESYSAYTGDYRHDIGFNNLKTDISNFLNPYGHWQYQNRREIQIRNQNLALEEQKTLVGNLYSNYKGV